MSFSCFPFVSDGSVTGTSSIGLRVVKLIRMLVLGNRMVHLDIKMNGNFLTDSLRVYIRDK